jgi:hypothetical protein
MRDAVSKDHDDKERCGMFVEAVILAFVAIPWDGVSGPSPPLTGLHHFRPTSGVASWPPPNLLANSPASMRS